jgi:hypothetical protein
MSWESDWLVSANESKFTLAVVSVVRVKGYLLAIHSSSAANSWAAEVWVHYHKVGENI